MAMLAERKRKQKWSLNPRGKEWSQDTNKFGQKMLEKMGWKSGKGLGAKLDGRTDHVKVSYKHDSKGMGYKETEQWTEHDQNFTELLNSLGDCSQVTEVDSKPKSLEEASANSKRRVHYRKFTRGKDLTRYTEKQLANIFGKKSLDVKKPEDTIETAKTIGEGKKHGVDTIEAGSMVDYFKNKLGGYQFGLSENHEGFAIGNNGVLKKITPIIEEESENEVERPSFGLGFKNDYVDVSSNQNVDSFTNGDTLEDTKSSKKVRKSKKRKLDKENCNYDFSNPVFDNNEIVDEESIVENLEENPYEIKPKKKKPKTKIVPAIIEHEEITIKMKKKSTKTEPVETMFSNASDIIVNKPKKKKRNKIEPLDNKDVVEKNDIIIKKKKSNNPPEDGPCVGIEEKPYKTKKDQLETAIDTSDVVVTDKKKKKKPKSGLENPNFDINDSVVSSILDESGDTTNEFEVKRKKKKSKRKLESGLDNPALNVSNMCIDDTCQEGANTSISKKICSGIDNLALNVSGNDSTIGSEISDVIECDLMLNVAGLPNCVKTRPLERRKSVTFAEYHQQIIIPNNYDNKLLEQKMQGLANAAFDERAATMEENLADIDKQLSTNCAEVENDLNEVRAAAHARLTVPVVPTTDNICHGNAGIHSLPQKSIPKRNSGEVKERVEDFPIVGEKSTADVHKLTPNGEVRLSYKLASLNVSHVPGYLRKVPKTSERATYKHLVKGDITLLFKNTNMHKIYGYGTAENIRVIEGDKKESVCF